MGTNFYWFKEEINPEVVDVCSGLHIGKCSCGWVFNFQVHKDKLLTTYHQYKEFTKNGIIYNEYGDLIPYNEFWEMVDSTKEKEDGREPLTLLNNPERSMISSINEYMNNGFMFTDCDFS